MKVLIVLVLLVVFAGCEETSEDQIREDTCEACEEGIRFAREHFMLNFYVI
jgi:hypothetical protein